MVKQNYYYASNMILTQIAFALLLITTQSAVVLNPITGITTKNLMYTGTIGVLDTEKLFFTYYGIDGQTNADNLSNNPTIIAVGTPGRSAQYMNLGGIGPKIVSIDGAVSDNANRATQFANVMFIDLLGAGFSFASSPSVLPKQAKTHASILSKAMNSFISQTNIGKSQNLYIVGQSNFIRTLPGFEDITSLKAIVHVSPWFDLYGIGQYYGAAGVEMRIFTNSQKLVLQSTFSNCYTSQRNNKFGEAHNCYDTTLNYIQNKTKVRNLYNIKLESNLTELLPSIQYYFSQPTNVNAYKAPNNLLFQAHASFTLVNLYEDYGRNIDTTMNKYLKDYLNVKQIFLTAENDFICYKKGTKNWLQNVLNFTQSAKFKPLNLTQYKQDGIVVGYSKSVNQISYFQLINAGHFIYNDQKSVIAGLLKQLTASSGQKGGNIREVLDHEHKYGFPSKMIQSIKLKFE